jgi:hypothetical protein
MLLKAANARTTATNATTPQNQAEAPPNGLGVTRTAVIATIATTNELTARPLVGIPTSWPLVLLSGG